MSNLDDVFIDKSGAMDVERTSFGEALNDALALGTTDAALSPKFVPAKAKAKVEARTSTTQAEAAQIASNITEEKEQETLENRIAELEATLRELSKPAGVGGVRVTKIEKPKPLDFTKLNENDVYDLNIPIVAIDHQVPDLTKVTLRDPNYVARYISMHPGRLGPMKAAGFTYVTPADIEFLELDIKPNENGYFQFIDVVLMKCDKVKYYGALRANYLRARSATNPAMLHKQMQAQTAKAIAEMPDPEGRTHKKDAQKYMLEDKLSVYI